MRVGHMTGNARWRSRRLRHTHSFTIEKKSRIFTRKMVKNKKEIYNLLKKSQLKNMYYIKIPWVRFMDLVRSNPQGGMVFEGLKNLDGIRQNGLNGHLWMDGGELRGWRKVLKKSPVLQQPLIPVSAFDLQEGIEKRTWWHNWSENNCTKINAGLPIQMLR